MGVNQKETNKVGFVNLKEIHQLQNNGALQELLRDLRYNKNVVDDLQKKLKIAKQQKAVESEKTQIKTVEVVERIEKQPIEQEKPTQVSQTPKNANNAPKEYNAKRDFGGKYPNKDRNNDRRFGDRSNQERKPFDRNLNEQNRNQFGQRPNRNFNPQNKPFQKTNTFGNNFASSKANTFKSFETEKPVIETNQRTFGNKNKSKQIDEKKTINKRALLRRNIIVDDSTDFEGERMGNRKLVKTKKKDTPVFVAPEITHAVITTENVSVKMLSEKTGKPVTELIKKLMLLGIMANINSSIDFATAELICSEFNITLEQKIEKSFEDKLQDIITVDDEKDLITRPPVVAVMGHVDHGKTSLLDYIRKTNIVSGEAGGITQRIGAYQIETNGQRITFIDTPGHAAFTAMRARGAKITDVAILVVAADDGIMPQTIEAINHIKAANVPMIVAVNKMDKPEANIQRVKEQLAENGVLPEEWGGDAIIVPVSAKKGIGIDELLSMILLVAEMQDLKANPSATATGTVIEAELDKNRGPIASILVQNGTLKVGDSIVSGITYGKVKAMFDENGKQVKQAGPSAPVAILGFNEVPSSGDQLYVVGEKLSKQVIEERISKLKLERAEQTSGVSLDDFMDRVNEGKLKTLNIIIKADVQGSVEALKQTLTAIRNEEVKVVCIHSGAGAVTESDVILAQASSAIIVNFNLKLQSKVASIADNLKVQIKDYKVIYEAVDEITSAIKGMMTIKYEQKVVGHAEVRMVFKLSSSGIVAGSYITDGKAIRNCGVRVMRNGEQVNETTIESLKIVKDDKAEVNYGYECGIKLKDSSDIKEGDILEFYQNIPIER